jgi:CRP-like cAMP-binding protein
VRARRRPDVALLAEVPPFDRYARTSLAPLIPHADRLRIADGTVVIREGHRARQLVIVVAGALLATRAGRPVGALGPGTWVGAQELLASGAHDCTLVAAEGLEVLVLNGPAYRWAVQTLPGLADVRVLDLRRVEAALDQQATFTG